MSDEAPLSVDGPVQTARLTLHVARAGQGRPLLFLGGSSFDMRLRRPVFSSALPRHFDVASHEPRGLGRSAHPAGEWTMVDYVEDACALMDALGWDTAHVVGESFGAMTAAALAASHPGRVRALCLIAATPGGPDGQSYPIERFASLEGRARAIAALTVQDMRFEAWLADQPAVAEARIEARMASDRQFLDDAGNAEGYPRLLAARAAHDVREQLQFITAPTVVMAGLHDGQAPLARVTALAQGIADSVLWAFDGGHAFAFASPAPMARLVAHWAAAPA